MSFSGDVEDFKTSSPSSKSAADNSMHLYESGYYADVELESAAELVAALVSKNKSAQEALDHSRLVEQEQAKEIEFLRKQLADSRKLNETEAGFFEEAEQSNRELQKQNRELREQLATDKNKIKHLSSVVAQLEDQLAEISARFEQHRSVCERLSDNQLLRAEHQRRPVRDQFIDDELEDQPQLGEHAVEQSAPSSRSVPNDPSEMPDNPDLVRLSDLLEDAALIKQMESICRAKLQCRFQSLTTGSYEPAYNALFEQAFKTLQDLRRRQSTRSGWRR